ncbi:hypothetical protein [Schleiferia thermophila]|uniref:Uncharacterized protein n=1 Tax=Schleiferia thermophila TaxID=884107 RepID=A0A369ABP5_9FLAO|nr:hypothetical protein [Schleiferia thermophila]RCX05507.1 hypothetical protein DES35_101794 [Schleiferia thermophila]GCD78997.1 hypothetical protein JCM30197_02440 [Schleiferia thermophila]
MANYVEFKGLKHYPIGDAELSLENETLVISNFGSDGQNGYQVKFGDISQINTKYAPYDFNEATHQNFKTISSSEDGDSFTSSELAFYKEGGSIYMAGNNLGNATNIVAKAYLNGEVIREWNPTDNLQAAAAAVPWWAVVYVVTHATVYYEKTVEGNKERHEIGGNWRGSKSIVQDNEGNEFETDRVTLTYEFDVVNPNTTTSLELRASNIESLTIDDYAL